MTRAAESDVRSESTWNRPGTIVGPDNGDQRILSAWLDQALGTGVDAVLDLGVRPWKITGVTAILGVFETRRDQASWLILRYGSTWMMARCSDGFISDISTSLPDILGLIDADLQR